MPNVEALRECEGSNGGEFAARFRFWSHSWEAAGFDVRDAVGGVDGGGCYRFWWLVSEEGGEAGYRDNWGEFGGVEAREVGEFAEDGDGGDQDWFVSNWVVTYEVGALGEAES